MPARKTAGRKPLRYLLLDFPSDHEVDGSLATESTALFALLTNEGLGTRVKHFRLSSLGSFKKLPSYSYDPKYVHVACHGGLKGIGLIEGWTAWDKFAGHLKGILQPLQPTHTRILTLSCCHSSTGAMELSKHLIGYFTGIYFFRPKTIGFGDALTCWCMFYLKKDLKNPHSGIREPINTFMATNILGYHSI